jgi:lipopolysaccharide transport system ATP-binding protein
MSTAIKVENLSKIYRLGEIGTGTITQDIDRWFKTKVLGKDDPFLKIGESNDRTQKGNGDIVYSLQNINFEINQGDAVGIIGRNGAGKSTLLKILSRVTTPTTGKINIRGRVASLLEVGTGFHPELTGRENIYLNGAILGMRKREIDRKLDEIIDFSGVERYIDTPVKRYSSGMYVRLAFAVAAHLESEILIVDEVLAVGDVEFQKKCLGKMGEVSKGEGRTVLFVSHNLLAIEHLCSKALFLEHGKVSDLNNVDIVIDKYASKDLAMYRENRIEVDGLILSDFCIGQDFVVELGEELEFGFCIYNTSSKLRKPNFNFEIKDIYGQFITCASNEFVLSNFMIDNNEKIHLSINIGKCYIKPGVYFVNFYYSDAIVVSDIYKIDFLKFEITKCDIFGTGRLPIGREHGVYISSPTIFANSQI